MFVVEEADFCPLNAFPLKWRWADTRYHVLPPAALATLKPL